LPKEKRVRRFDWAKANPLGSLRLLSRHPALMKLATVNFLYQLAHNVFSTIFVLYSGYRYGWDPAIIGLTLMGNGLCNALVQIFLVGPVVRRMGERGSLLMGLIAGTLGFSIFALAPTGLVYLTSIPMFSLMGLVQPSLQGLMTRRVADHEQGQLQGANSCIMGITAIIGPPIFGLTFAWSIHRQMLPGLAILIAASLMLASFILILLAPAKSASSVVVLPDDALESESVQSAG
jgi:DHA1 family tetracycline resistance protein-like MFS transporter